MADEDTKWCDVGSVEELRTRALQEVKVGRSKIALSHRDGAFHAISGHCNHVGGPLGQGRLDGEYVVCPWHNWKFHFQTGEGEPVFEEDRVPAHDVKVENGRVLVNAVARTTRNKRPHDPHPLTQLRPRGTSGGPPIDAPLRVVGISTTVMDNSNPRESTSDILLDVAMEHAGVRGADTRTIRLRDLSFRSCEGYYSKSARACTWPCSITQMDPNDQLIACTRRSSGGPTCS